MTSTTRVRGHALIGEGGPYNSTGQRIWVNTGMYPYGRGLCECGAFSDVLANMTARRIWHREHKHATKAAS